MKTRVLIIPHQPHRNVKVRAVEMAKYLAGQGDYQVYVLTWQASAPQWTNPVEKLFHKIGECRCSINTPTHITTEADIHWVTLPYLLAPYPACQWFNQQQVERFVEQHQIQVVISGNGYHFPMPKKPKLYRIYDVVDDHLSPNSGPAWQRTRAFTLNELKHAHRIISISQALQDELTELGFPSTTRIPNGVDLSSYQTFHQASVENIRNQHGLHNQLTIGYIGNHGWWSGMDLLLDAFQIFQKQVPNSRLLIVGPGEELPRYQKQTAGNPHIIYTGAIPPQDIAPYFQAIDIGVLPFQRCPFTDNAMPLKILEYGAARKKVVSTPLKELATLQFPHVSILEADPAQWAEALVREALSPSAWQPEWDTTIAAYNWPVILQELTTLLEQHPHASAV